MNTRSPCILILLLLLCVVSLQAQKPVAPLSDARELESFLDGVMTSQLAAYNIPGATLALVKDGKLFFAKGYGYADVAQRKPVLADRSLFRIGSVSKLFVWTAVMQLYEQGKLDLDKDVNEYLRDFKIPATYPQPVTMKHLMSHSPGFEDRLPIFAHSASDLEPAGRFLSRTLPARVRPPGRLSAYTNHGTALAGYIVEQISGKSFEEYVKENILKPLQMNHSSFRQPLPPDLEPDMSRGYQYVAGTFEAKPFEFVRVAAAGSMSSTATDMANFMIAHLQNGRFANRRMLQDATAQKMHSFLFTHDPRASGWAYGFMEMTFDTVRAIGHGGDTFLFHTLLVLLPEYNVGLFVSYNSMGQGDGAASARGELLRAFLNRYYHIVPQPMPQLPLDFVERAKRFEGSYWPTRLPQTTAHKMMGLVQQTRITLTPDSTLLSAGPLTSSREWVEIEPMRFRATDGPSLRGDLLFWEDAGGKIIGFCQTNNPTTAYTRVPWHQTLSFNIFLLVLCIVIFLSAIIGWPIGYFIRRRRVGEGTVPAMGARVARWFAGIVSVLFVLFTILLSASLGNPYEFAYDIPGALIPALWVGLLASILTVGVLVSTVFAWKNRYWSVPRRVHFTLVALAAVAFVWWLNLWNQLGINL